MKHHLKRYLSAGISVALLLAASGCSDKEKKPAGEIKSNSGSISAEVAKPPAEETPDDGGSTAEASFIIPPMTDEQAKYNTDYVEPLRFCSMLLKSWSPEDTSGLESTSEYAPGASTSLMFAFEDIIGSDAMQAIYKDYPDGNIPEGIVDEVLLAHFSFTLEQLHELNTFYRPEQKVYEYTGARGGGEVQSVVTQVTEQGDGTILLEYSYLVNFPDPTQALYRVPGTMTLVPDGNGGYRYLSVEAQAPEQYPLGTEATLKIDDVTITLTLTPGWTATGNELYLDDVKAAELLPCAPNGDAHGYDAIDAQYGAAMTTHTYVAGGFYGKCYHMQSEVSKDGLTVLENQLHYYTDIPTASGPQLLHFAFYPLHGTGIASQREAFEVVLNSLVVQAT